MPTGANIFSIIAVILLAGCSARHWYHDTKSEKDFRVDEYECLKDSAPADTNPLSWQPQGRARHMQRKCMEVKGWRLHR